MAGGHVHALIHLSEFVTIGGASIGALVIMTPKKTLIDLIRAVLALLKGSPYNKASAAELLKLFYGIGKVVRQEGVLGLETHIGAPQTSAIFKASPKILANGHLKHFVCDGLALLVDGKPTPEQLQSWLQEETRVIDQEHHQVVAALTKVGDALPGFGIVAAVLGIVVTMQAIGGPVEEIGHKVGAALVGTFLGILMAYGFCAPLAGRLDALGVVEMSFLNAVSAGVVAIGEGVGPRDVVTRARRCLGTECRPSQGEMQKIFSEAKGG
ncbi:flagellar motor stator protein MotA [Limnoglobus roseus]|uniref:Flagellar motor stator protein MotA n=2 Tax=Limnoglobus roseus TaxID=2598579 RepID=A0A5C1AAZ4_9BACT|nr:flagellar motor stator protein MotA [Limnoglobus roseus]